MRRFHLLDRLLTALFSAILRGYPRPFRERAAAEMLRTFQDELQKRTGGLERIRWGVQESVDALGSLLVAWLETATHLGRRRRMDGTMPTGQQSPDGRSTAFWEGLGNDFRMALRALVRRPGFAVFVGATLALGIGANVAVFSVLHSVLLAPLPYDEPGRLVRMYWNERGQARGAMSEPAFLDFREHLTSVRIAAYDNYGGRDFGADVMVEGRPERVRLLPVTAGYFDVLGADVILGRAFSRDDEEEGAAPVAVVSDRLWRRAMQADPAAIGSTLRLDGASHQVIGVIASDFIDPLKGRIDVWVPDHFDAQPWEWFGNNYLTVLGRLSPGATLERAQAEATVRNVALLELAGEEDPDDWHRGVLVPLQDDLTGSAEPMLLVLMGAVVVLLLITCANVTALVLARGRELSIRAALGSGRARLVRNG